MSIEKLEEFCNKHNVDWFIEYDQETLNWQMIMQENLTLKFIAFAKSRNFQKLINHCLNDAHDCLIGKRPGIYVEPQETIVNLLNRKEAERSKVKRYL